MKNKNFWLVVTGVLSVSILCVLLLFYKNESYIEFSTIDGTRLENGSKIMLEYGVDKEIAPIIAIYKETIFNRRGTELEQLTIVGEYDETTVGNYPIRLCARHKDIKGEMEVLVSVEDHKKPEIILEGEENMILRAGESYEEPGFVATDNYDGDVTEQVVVRGDVRANGTSFLEYEVTDSSGNISVVKRTITVEIEENQKIIYLTYDDGPTFYTKRLLDVLDKYNVKASFFVTNGNENYHDMIGEAYRRGHTIAAHSFSHDYSKIYENSEAFYEDLKIIENLIVEQTGEKPSILRFPGGTANKVSDDSQEGVMIELVNTLPEHGYIHCDWNVTSGDGGGAKDEETVINNVLGGIQRLSRREQAVVLMHDTRWFSVDATDDIIEWGLENGYTFLPLIPESPMPQQAPQK